MKLLAGVDLSQYAPSVCDHAAWLAMATGGSVELLHVIQRKDAVKARHDLSGALGLGAKSSLMDELVRIEEAETRIAREQGQALLRVCEVRMRSAGVEQVTTVHRHGGIVETVVEREAQADLVVIGKRGASANFAKGHLGSKVERVVRESVKPVLVANRAFKPIKRVLIAFDNGQSARKAVSFAATSPAVAGLHVDLLLVGADSERNRDALRWANEVLGERCRRSEIVGGHVDDTLLAETDRSQTDLLMMGAYGHSPLRAMMVGSTTTTMLRRVRLPVLLFR